MASDYKFEVRNAKGKKVKSRTVFASSVGDAERQVVLELSPGQLVVVLGRCGNRWATHQPYRPGREPGTKPWQVRATNRDRVSGLRIRDTF